MTPQPDIERSLGVPVAADMQGPSGPAATGDGGAQDRDIVLPWWQNPVNIVIMLATVALLAGMTGWLVGQSRDDGVATSDVDIGFLQDMRVHHDQAIDMSRIFLERPDTAPGLRTVAEGVLIGQSIEIGLMVQLLRDMDAPTEGEEGQAMAWMGPPMADGDMPGMATVDQLEALAASAGADADELFVELMVAHHQGGIDMAGQAAARAANPDVRGYATMWADSQADEIAEMQGLLRD